MSAADEEAALKVVLDPNLQPYEVVLEDITKPVCNPPSHVDFLDSSSPNRVSVGVDTPEEGYVVLADTWYPGWRATLDDQPVEIIRADYLFRAVQVPAGMHKIEFVYRPVSFQIGLAVSVIAWLLFAFLWRRKHVQGK